MYYIYDRSLPRLRGRDGSYDAYDHYGSMYGLIICLCQTRRLMTDAAMPVRGRTPSPSHSILLSNSTDCPCPASVWIPQMQKARKFLIRFVCTPNLHPLSYHLPSVPLGLAPNPPEPVSNVLHRQINSCGYLIFRCHLQLCSRQPFIRSMAVTPMGASK